MESTDDFEGSTSRRRLLKGAVAGAGALWVAPTIDSFVSPAAAASGTATAALRKDANGGLLDRCISGCGGALGLDLCGPVSRGDIVFTRTTGSPDEICASITLDSGPSTTGRSVYILQSDGTDCLEQTLVGTWAATPAQGPQVFCADIVPGATWFTIHSPQSGGGGTDIYSSDGVNLP
jgi:hypothetical protein